MCYLNPITKASHKETVSNRPASTQEVSGRPPEVFSERTAFNWGGCHRKSNTYDPQYKKQWRLTNVTGCIDAAVLFPHSSVTCRLCNTLYPQAFKNYLSHQLLLEILFVIKQDVWVMLNVHTGCEETFPTYFVGASRMSWGSMLQPLWV